MPAANPPRWITIINAPFDYFWPDRSAVTAYRANGEFLVKAEVADYAVSHGYAIDGKPKASRARSTKGKSPRRQKSSKAKGDAATTDHGTDARMAGPGVATDDRAPVRSAVDPAAG